MEDDPNLTTRLLVIGRVLDCFCRRRIIASGRRLKRGEVSNVDKSSKRPNADATSAKNKNASSACAMRQRFSYGVVIL